MTISIMIIKGTLSSLFIGYLCRSFTSETTEKKTKHGFTDKQTYSKGFYDKPHAAYAIESQQSLEYTVCSRLPANSQWRGHRYILKENLNPRDNLQRDILFIFKWNVDLTAVMTAKGYQDVNGCDAREEYGIRENQWSLARLPYQREQHLQQSDVKMVLSERDLI